MITIDNLDDNTIDLGKKQTHFELNVTSKSDDGTKRLFGIDLVTSEFINVNTFSLNSISIDIDAPNIAKKEYIILKNTLNERVKIKVIPDEYYTMKKMYKFKITKKVFEDDGSLKIKILSMVNNMELGWKCIYDGKPMEYDITPRSNDSSCFVIIKPMSHVYSDFETVVNFQQNESNNIIKLTIHNTQKGIRKEVDNIHADTR